MFKVGTTNESTTVKWIEDTLKKIPEGLTILDAGAGEIPYKKYVAQENRRVKFVAAKYLNKKINIFQKIIIHLNLLILQSLSKKDKGSSELLCYGIHVFPRKK